MELKNPVFANGHKDHSATVNKISYITGRRNIGP
jgi:hypothetical protein